MAPLTGRSAPAFRDRRRAAVAGSGSQRGLDHARAERRPDGRWLLTLFFVPSAVAQKPSVPPGIGRENVRLSLAGGTAETGLVVEAIEPGGPDAEPDSLGVRLAQSGALPAPVPGEPLTYLVELVDVRNLDRFFTTAPFTLEPGLPTPIAPPPPRALPRLPAAPAIDYMAKDYASFRQLMLERMTLAIPSWTERNPSDYGIAAVEVLAYAADYLSYYQDAVATEAYLATARRRVSVRRLARLVDYRLNDGLNTRTWLAVQVSGASGEGEDFEVDLPERTGVLTRFADLAPVVDVSWVEERWVRRVGADFQAFETMAPATFRASQNAMQIYLWGAVELTLPAGTTSVALQGHPTLAQGDVLLFESRATAADPATGHRPYHAVRLSAPPVFGCDSTWPGSPPITEISWFAEDALPEPLVVSVYRDGVQEADLVTVRGNVVPVDHGRTVWEELPPVPPRGAYRPALSQSNVTIRAPFHPQLARHRPASETLEQDPQEALPAVVLYEIPGYEAALVDASNEATESITRRGRRWEARYDLLAAGRFDRCFVVEVEQDGSASLRFGDGVNGEQPVSGSRFWAVYRVGLGTKGNVGPGTLGHLVAKRSAAEQEVLFSAIETVGNPLQATGGTAPEPIEQVRRLAPHGFYAAERCVTEEDFVRAATAVSGVLAAVAELRFTGSWETAFVYVQRPAGLPLDASFERRLRGALAPQLVAGYQLAIAGPRYVPIEIVLKVELAPRVAAEPVRQELATRLGSGDLPDGTHAYFYPDRFRFGQPLYLSEIVAAAAETPGVAWVEPLRFQRWGEPPRGELAAGRIEVGPLEIVRVESRPGAPQLGSITFRMETSR